MQSRFASLRSLTLPAGATTGGRIVLDGINGQIAIYNTDGDLIGVFDPNGLVFYSRDFNPARVFVYDPVQNVQTIYVDDGTETAVIQLDGRPDTQGIWIIDAATGGYVHIAPDANGAPGIEFNDASGTTSYLALPGTDGSRLTTPDVSPLRIPSELDVRVDLQTSDWTPSKQRGIAQRGPNDLTLVDWDFRLRQTGRLTMTWVDTIGITHNIDSTANPVPAGDGRLAVRFTLDTNAGAGNGEVKFYTAATIAGPWVQLGSTVTFAATANIAASINVTTRIGSDNPPGSVGAWVGKLYAAQIYNGIGAPTLVANPDLTIQPAGVTSFTDSVTRVWSVTGSASLVTLGLNPGRLSAGPNGDVLINGSSIPRGVPSGGYFRNNASDVARAAGVNTNAFITFTADATRLYEIVARSQATVGTAAAVYGVELSEGGTAGTNSGTVIGRFVRWQASDTAAGNLSPALDSTVLYLPLVSGATTLRIRNAVASGGTLQLIGGAGNFTELYAKDIGKQ